MTQDEIDALILLVQVTGGATVRETKTGHHCAFAGCYGFAERAEEIRHANRCPVGAAMKEDI
ncbi:MAG TPA: hypothetical protein VN828_03710 [Acidobacteriaceae bacterium]|nr:hypothetical protein [Acidobacteriaceae bacterium]